MPAYRPTLVLIAAEDQAVRDALQFALRLEGFGVRAHAGGDGLLDDAGLGRARCVILDDRKPYLDGFEVMGRLRARGVATPVILLASYATARLRSRAAVAGFRAVLEKPLLNNILLDTLRTIVEAPQGGETGGETVEVRGRPVGLPCEAPRGPG